MASYYIYYRVQPEKAAACRAIVQDLIAAVRKATGVSGRLLTKRGEPNLWMEIYDNVPDETKFEWEIADAAGRLNIQHCLLPGSGRHFECFEEPSK